VKTEVPAEPMDDALHGGRTTPGGVVWIRASTGGRRWAKRGETGCRRVREAAMAGQVHPEAREMGRAVNVRGSGIHGLIRGADIA
jgi:hypothetical protein